MIILYVYIHANNFTNFLRVMKPVHMKYPVISKKQFIPVFPHIPSVHKTKLLMLVGELPNGPVAEFVAVNDINPELTTP